MIPYLVLIFLPLVFLYVELYKKKGRSAFIVGTNSRIQSNNLMVPMFFIVYFLLLCLRHETIGNDTAQYKSHYETISRLGWEAISGEGDFLYYLLNFIVSRLTANFRAFLIIVTAIILLPIGILYSEERDYGFLKIVTFLILPNFIMIFSGLRQSIAFAVGVVAYYCVREKKLLLFLLFGYIAMQFHHSAFIIFILYPIYHARLRKKHLWFIVPCLVLVYMYNGTVFGTLTGLIARFFGEEYDVVMTTINAYEMLILFVMMTIVSYVLPDEKRMDQETFGLRNILLVAVIIQCFTPLHALAMRMNYYFILFIPVLMPKIIKSTKKEYARIGYLCGLVMTVFFLIYYLDKLYTSCMSGVSSLGTYPYRFFWQ